LSDTLALRDCEAKIAALHCIDFTARVTTSAYAVSFCSENVRAIRGYLRVPTEEVRGSDRICSLDQRAVIPRNYGVIFGAVAERATCKVCWRTGATTPTCATACGHIGLHAVRKAKLKIRAIRGNLGIVSQELRAGQVELRLDGTTNIAGYDSIVLLMRC